MEGKLLRGNIRDGGKLWLNRQHSCCSQARIIRVTREGGVGFDQILRVIRYQGQENWLDRILTKTALCRSGKDGAKSRKGLRGTLQKSS